MLRQRPKSHSRVCGEEGIQDATGRLVLVSQLKGNYWCPKGLDKRIIGLSRTVFPCDGPWFVMHIALLHGTVHALRTAGGVCVRRQLLCCL